MANPGDTLIYSVQVCNTGPSMEPSVTFSDPIPSDLTIIPGTASVSQGSITTGNNQGDTEVAANIGALAPSACATVTFCVRVNDPAAASVNNIATANHSGGAENGNLTTSVTVRPGLIGACYEDDGNILLASQHGFITAGSSGNTFQNVPNHVACGGDYAGNTPNSGQFWATHADAMNTAGSLCWPVSVNTAGTWYVWLKGESAAGTDDSAWVGTALSATTVLVDSFGTFNDGRYQWNNQDTGGSPAQINLAAGSNTICVWPREDGFRVDSLWLTTDPNATVFDAEDCLGFTCT